MPDSTPKLRTLTADDIVRIPRPIETVEMPDIGGRFRLRALSGDAATFFQCLCKRLSDNGSVEYRGVKETLVALAVVDDDGKPLFEFNLDDVATLGPAKESLGSLPAAVLDRLWTIARRLNGLSQEDVDFYVGNSDAEPSDSSPSA